MGDINLRRITRTEALDQGFTDRQLAQLIRTGALLRVRPGEYALPAEWSAVESHRQHRELVLRTAERVTAPQIYSHHAAAALWGIRIRRSWPPRVDVLVGRAHGGRSSGRLRRWALGFEGREIVESDGLLLTSPGQTVIDLARELPFTDAVVVADSALGTAFGRGALTTHSGLIDRLADARNSRGIGRARAVIAEADGPAEQPSAPHGRDPRPRPEPAASTRSRAARALVFDGARQQSLTPSANRYSV